MQIKMNTGEYYSCFYFVVLFIFRDFTVVNMKTMSCYPY